MNGVAPQLQSYHRPPKQQVKPNLTKHQVLYSKTLPGQERRRAYLDSLIDGLKQHPLALYSHIEESVPPEVSPISSCSPRDENYDLNSRNEHLRYEIWSGSDSVGETWEKSIFSLRNFH